VDFEPARVVVTVRLRSRKLFCPKCGFTAKARYDTRPASSSWRHIDLGRWRLEVLADLRRIDCPTHGARTEGAPPPGPAWEGSGIPVHDRGKVLVQTALVLSGGGESCLDVEYLRTSYNRKLWIPDLTKGATYPPS
jgi:transposase